MEESKEWTDTTIIGRNDYIHTYIHKLKSDIMTTIILPRDRKHSTILKRRLKSTETSQRFYSEKIKEQSIDPNQLMSQIFKTSKEVLKPSSCWNFLDKESFPSSETFLVSVLVIWRPQCIFYCACPCQQHKFKNMNQYFKAELDRDTLFKNCTQNFNARTI